MASASAPAPGASASQDRLPSLSGPRIWPLLYALAAAAVAYVNTGGNVFRLNGIAPWLVAIVFWIYAWWPRRPAGLEHQDDRRAGTPVWVLVGLALALAIGIFFRFHRLAETPSDPTSDHAEKLLDVQDILDGQRSIFLPRNTGREPAQFYVIAAMVTWLHLPPDFETMKLGTAAVDVLTIPAVYLLAAELGGPAVGLAAALAYSFGSWPVGIARAGLRFPYAPLPTALTLWLLLRYLRRGDRRDALLCGLTLGVGLYGYSPFRVIVPVIPMALGLAGLLDRRWRHVRAALARDGALILLTATVVFIPLGHYMVEKPDMFWYRAASRAVAPDTQAPPGPAQLMLGAAGVFLANNLNAALAFNVRGDSTHVNAPRHAPFLDTLTGLVFLVGVAVAGYRFFSGRDLRPGIMLLSLPVLFLSSTLALGFPVENPSVNRAGPALPVAFALVGLGLVTPASRGLRQPDFSTRALTAALLVIGLTIAAAENYERYFIRFDRQYRDFVPNSTEIGAAVRIELARGVPLDQVYHLSWPFWLDTRNLAIALGDIRWAERQVVPENRPLPEPGAGPLVFVIHRDDHRRMEEIRRRWPTAVLRRYPSELPAREFVLAIVPAAQ